MANELKYIPSEGDVNSKVVIVGEAPGEEEQKLSKPFCGKAGNLLNEALSNINLNRENILITNVVKVRPPENRKPTKAEIDSWRDSLWSELTFNNRNIIVSLGSTALEALFPNQGLKISEQHGKILRCDLWGSKFFVLALYHPSFVVRGYYNKEQYFKDFKKIKEFI